ncbi:hypothetical protein BaRGS_00037000 [Batillaria attramentaria]|uniref:Uncharacterized protein n=1 Tax=Batillaria attramentaria TaxID=370345 RepID=A0ABD0JB44_9CAEN
MSTQYATLPSPAPNSSTKRGRDDDRDRKEQSMREEIRLRIEERSALRTSHHGQECDLASSLLESDSSKTGECHSEVKGMEQPAAPPGNKYTITSQKTVILTADTCRTSASHTEKTEEYHDSDSDSESPTLTPTPSLSSSVTVDCHPYAKQFYY